MPITMERCPPAPGTRVQRRIFYPIRGVMHISFSILNVCVLCMYMFICVYVCAYVIKLLYEC
jgi:hypothetical protein